jgi:hypothetical protein
VPDYDAYLVQEEDGVSHFELEDGSGDIILETAVPITDTPATAAAAGAAHQRIRDEQRRRNLDDEEALLLLTELI